MALFSVTHNKNAVNTRTGCGVILGEYPIYYQQKELKANTPDIMESRETQSPPKDVANPKLQANSSICYGLN